MRCACSATNRCATVPNGIRGTRQASEASRCVSCHMPRNMEALLFRARSHQIDEIPDAEMTARFGAPESPNACLSCHRDKDARWLVDSMAAWRPGRELARDSVGSVGPPTRGRQ